jgi:ATPase family associated with various cellular activities (AAA)
VRPLHRELLDGLWQLDKGLLLFGPLGAGKTMIGKCVARTAEATLVSIRSSSLASKWVGTARRWCARCLLGAMPPAGGDLRRRDRLAADPAHRRRV